MAIDHNHHYIASCYCVTEDSVNIITFIKFRSWN